MGIWEVSKKMNGLECKLEEFVYMLDGGPVSFVSIKYINTTYTEPILYFVGRDTPYNMDCGKERNRLATDLFDASLRGGWIWRIALSRKDGFPELAIELKTHSWGETNITGEVVNRIMYLSGNWR